LERERQESIHYDHVEKNGIITYVDQNI